MHWTQFWTECAASIVGSFIGASAAFYALRKQFAVLANRRVENLQFRLENQERLRALEIRMMNDLLEKLR